MSDSIDHGFTVSRDHDGNGINGGMPHRRPHPLPQSLLPAAAFEFELLPDQLWPWVADVCERLQCPPDYVGCRSWSGPAP